MVVCIKIYNNYYVLKKIKIYKCIVQMPPASDGPGNTNML